MEFLCKSILGNGCICNKYKIEVLLRVMNDDLVLCAFFNKVLQMNDDAGNSFFINKYCCKIW